MTEDSQHRELDGPSANIALSEIISNALPSDGKKDKLDLNNVNDMNFTILQRQTDVVYAILEWI